MNGGFWPHSVLQCINFAVERLNLPPGLISLLLSLPQGISVFLCRLSQISKLQQTQNRMEDENDENRFADLCH